MATCSLLLNNLQITGCQPLTCYNLSVYNTSERLECLRKSRRLGQSPKCTNHSFLAVTSSVNIHLENEVFPLNGTCVSKTPEAVYDIIPVLADLDPATAKLAIGFIGPFLTAFSFLFIIRIVMSWYPKLPVAKFPYVLAFAPTEPILIPTRKLIPPLGGVDVTPVVWFGLLSFLNEILVGPQGLLVLISRQVS